MLTWGADRAADRSRVLQVPAGKVKTRWEALGRALRQIMRSATFWARSLLALPLVRPWRHPAWQVRALWHLLVVVFWTGVVSAAVIAWLAATL